MLCEWAPVKWVAAMSGPSRTVVATRCTVDGPLARERKCRGITGNYRALLYCMQLHPIFLARRERKQAATWLSSTLQGPSGGALLSEILWCAVRACLNRWILLYLQLRRSRHICCRLPSIGGRAHNEKLECLNK